MVKALIAGTGHMKEEHFAAFQRQLERSAVGAVETGSAIGRPRTAEEMRMLVRQLGMGGFKVEIEGGD